MSLFFDTLREGGPAFTVEQIDGGFLIHVVPGREAGFNDIARLVIDKAGPTFAAFPRPMVGAAMIAFISSRSSIEVVAAHLVRRLDVFASDRASIERPRAGLTNGY